MRVKHISFSLFCQHTQFFADFNQDQRFFCWQSMISMEVSNSLSAVNDSCFLTAKVFVKSLIAVSFSLPSPFIKRGTWQSGDVFGPEHVGLFIANMNKVPKFVFNMSATPINHRYIMIYLYHWHPCTILTVTYLETIRRYQNTGLPTCWSLRTWSYPGLGPS